MKKILTHKFLPIMAVFMLVIFTLCTSCFASTNSEESVITITFDDGSDKEIPNPYLYSEYVNGTYTKYIIFYNNSGNFYCYFFNSYSINSTNLTISDCQQCYIFDATSDGIPIWTVSNSNSKSFSLSSISKYYSSDNLIDSNGNVVFQGAPQVEEVPKVELMKATQVEEIPQQILAIVKIVLPILLSLFGVLLVLYLIKSKNLLQL